MRIDQNSSSPSQGRCIVVTGAAGAVGSQLVRVALQKGHRVVGVDRNPTQIQGLSLDESARYSEKIGDLTHRRFCKSCVEGADWVIHAAAHNDSRALYEEVEPINVEAVRWLYEASEDAGVERFVYVSTASLYEEGRGVRDEEAAIHTASTYTESKRQAEKFLLKRRKGSLPWVIVRPSLVYGPRAKAFGSGVLMLPPLLRLFFTHIPSITGGPRNNWVHVEDVARACLLLAEHKDSVNQIYNVADDTPLSYGEILSATIQAYGLGVGPSITFPQMLLSNITRFIDTDLVFDTINNIAAPLWQMVVARYKLEPVLRPRLNRALLDYISGDRVVGCDKLKALGWVAKWPDLREGIALTIPWYQKANWVPNYTVQDTEDPPEGIFGLSFHERLQGTASIREEDASREVPVSFELDVSFPNLRQLLAKRTAMLEGVIDLEGIADHCPVMGTVELMPSDLKMMYQFGFTAFDGSTYRFTGAKRLSIFKPVQDFSRITGSLVDARAQRTAQIDVSIPSKEGLIQTLTSIRLG